MKNDQFTVTTEQVDDFILLIHIIMRLGLPGIIDQHIPRHHLQNGLSWGWVTTIWLSHIISQGDHRKITVRDWVNQTKVSIQEATGLEIRDTDFTDDRLAIVLKNLSKPEYWISIENELSQTTIQVYDIKPKLIRVDATTVSGYHEGSEDSLFQFGKSKDDPALRQVKVMMGSLDPLGFPIATDVVSGERADDGLYVPCIGRILETLSRKTGLLFVGDCKLSATATRAYIHNKECYYLTPLAMVGKVSDQMDIWVQKALQSEKSLQTFEFVPGDGKKQQVKGYETTRSCEGEVDGKLIQWDERIFIVWSETYAQVQIRGLEKRLTTAREKILTLTPAPGRGKRQITDEQELITRVEEILEKHHITGLIEYTFEKQVELATKYVGRGRGGQNHTQQTIEKVRCQITSVTINETAVKELNATYGWRAYATNAPDELLSLETAVLTYRDEWLIERGFHRLKGAPLSLDPMYVKRDDQATGLINLLSLAVRILTLIEFVVRRALEQQNTTLIGLHKENPKKANSKPTTERLLQAFSNIFLTTIYLPDRTLRHITPLSDLQTKILSLLDLSPDIYLSLAKNSS
jgi:transposase